MRTEGGVVKLERNGKWSVSFNTFSGVPGEEFLINTCTSAAVFATEGAAIAGQSRALDYLTKLGKFPNMCVAF